ncbi:hypothetical protein Btru_028987 [Bulinus truncatus]|nr:hypothetical protein Btru_028987 [Bulinus truncatus]
MDILAPDNIETLEPGSMDILAPGNIDTLEPGSMDILAPDNIETLEPGSMDILAPDNIETLEPGIMGTLAPELVQISIDVWSLVYVTQMVEGTKNKRNCSEIIIITPSYWRPSATRPQAHGRMPSYEFTRSA